MFDAARTLVLVDVDGERQSERRPHELEHADPLARAHEVARLGADVLICGAISRPLERALTAEGVRVVPRTCGVVDEVLQAFLQRRLSGPAFLMPGCGRRRRRAGYGAGRRPW